MQERAWWKAVTESIPPLRRTTTFSLAGLGAAQCVIAGSSLFLRALAGVGGFDGNADAASGSELAVDGHGAWSAGSNEVVENAVCDLFVERAVVSERGEVELQRLGLDAELVRNILNLDGCEVRLSSDGAKGSEVIHSKLDQVIPMWIAVRERFEGG